MTTTIANFNDTATGWQRAFYAFLAEKEQRSGSRRTVEGYSRMLQDFFGRSGKQPDNVTPQDIFVYAHSPGLSGKQPSAITIGARIACNKFLLSFSHSHGYRPIQPLRQTAATADITVNSQRPCPVTRCISFLKWFLIHH